MSRQPAGPSHPHADAEEHARRRTLLLDYLAAFNRADIDAVVGRLHPGFRFDRGSWPPLEGPEEFADFYRDLWSRTTETVRLDATSWDGAWLHADLRVDLTVHEDCPAFPGGPLLRGDAIVGARNRLRYRFVDGLLHTIVDQSPEPDLAQLD
jgi:hypothetical protein